MGPDRRVVAKTRDLVDLVLRLHIPMLGAADEDACAILGNAVPIESAVLDGLVRAINRQGPGPRATPQVLLFLVPQDVATADPRQDLAHVAGLETHDARTAGEQALTKLLQVIPVGSRQPDPRNDNAVAITRWVGHRG